MCVFTCMCMYVCAVCERVCESTSQHFVSAFILISMKQVIQYSYIYIQQDARLHSLFYLETTLRVLGGTTTHHQEHKQLYLQHLVFVTPLLLTAAIAAGISNGVTNTRCCRYSCLRS